MREDKLYFGACEKFRGTTPNISQAGFLSAPTNVYLRDEGTALPEYLRGNLLCFNKNQLRVSVHLHILSISALDLGSIPKSASSSGRGRKYDSTHLGSGCITANSGLQLSGEKLGKITAIFKQVYDLPETVRRVRVWTCIGHRCWFLFVACFACLITYLGAIR